MYKFSFFVPETHLESVKLALMKAGAGKIGLYEQCAWQTLGTGQYLPLKKSNPYQGTPGKLEAAPEYKVETIVADELIKPVCQALIETHPYEEPVYGFWKILMLDDLE